MKDIMQKLSELEATAPKVTKKKMLNEDSTTPPMNAETSPTRLKDIFETMAMQKPIPVVGKQGDTQQTGAGFLNVTDNSPAAQALGNALADLAGQKKVQIVMPTQPGQQQAGQPAPAGATGQPQAGQMQMKEKDEGKPGKNFAKIAKSAAKRYGSKEAGERVAGAVRAKLAKQGKLEEESMEESGLQAYLGNKKYGKEGMDALRKAGREGASKEKMAKIRAKYDKMDEAQLDEKFASQQQAKLMYATAGGADTGVSKKVAKEFIKKSHGQKVGKLPKKKTDEADIAPTSSIDTKGAGLGAGRSQTTLEGAKPDFLDLDKDGNKKEPMKKAAADKKKKKVDESMNHRISAARLEGKSHGLRGHAHSGKRYEDLEELKAYHEGYKEGLDECYGQGVYETAPAATVPGMASQAMEDNYSLTAPTLGTRGDVTTRMPKAPATPSAPWPALITYKHPSLGSVELLGYDDLDIAQDHVDSGALTPKTEVIIYSRKESDAPRKTLAKYVPQLKDLFDVAEGNLFTGNLAKARASGAKSFDLDGDGDMEKVKETAFAFEAWDRELANLLNESEEVTEGLSVSVSKGQQNSPDSVTITAQDAEADQLLQLVKSAGLGLFGGDEGHEAHPSSAMSIQPAHGAADEVGAGGVDIDVVDGSDGMLSLMKKLSGVEVSGSEDYADEEDCGCKEETNEATCNECGMMEGMHEAGCSMGKGKEMVDEVESEDQMEFEVAEDNAPDSETAEHNADEEAEAQEDAALAKSDSKGGTYTVNEDGDEASEEGPESKEGEGDEGAETVSESFANLFKKLSFIAEESTEKEDEKAEKAGKKVTKDLEYDDKKDKKEKVDEWANQVGSGEGKGTDASFQQDIDFMTKVIAGGLNKPKSTGQTTIPVIAGQEDRMHDSPKDWATLAGIKK